MFHVFFQLSTIVILAWHWCFDTPWVPSSTPNTLLVLYISLIMIIRWKLARLLQICNHLRNFFQISITPQLFNSDPIYKLATGTSTLIHMMINHHLLEWENYKYINLFSPPQMGLENFCSYNHRLLSSEMLGGLESNIYYSISMRC